MTRGLAEARIWRLCLALGATLLGAGLIASCSNPERYRGLWCSNFQDAGAYECSYNSFEECQAAISGVGGLCVANPRYPGEATKPRRSAPPAR